MNEKYSRRDFIRQSGTIGAGLALTGRTDQYEPVDHLITETEGVTSAKDLLKTVHVSCEEKS